MEKELIEFVAKKLVEKPESVTVTAVEGEKSSVLELRVAEEDLGRVIGKKGKIANAMRVLLQSLSSKEGKRITLEIID